MEQNGVTTTDETPELKVANEKLDTYLKTKADGRFISEISYVFAAGAIPLKLTFFGRIQRDTRGRMIGVLEDGFVQEAPSKAELEVVQSKESTANAEQSRRGGDIQAYHDGLAAAIKLAEDPKPADTTPKG